MSSSHTAPVVSFEAGDDRTASLVTMSPTWPQRSVPPRFGVSPGLAPAAGAAGVGMFALPPGGAVPTTAGAVVAAGPADGALGPHAASNDAPVAVNNSPSAL